MVNFCKFAMIMMMYPKKEPMPELKLKQSKGEPKIIREKRMAESADGITVGVAYPGKNEIILFDNISATDLSVEEKIKIKKKNEIAKKSEKYTIAHEKHHIHNSLANPNFSDLNFAYHYLLGINDEISSISDNNALFFESLDDVYNASVASFNAPYFPNMRNQVMFDIKSEAFNIILSAHIQVVKHIDTYWNHARQTIVGRIDNVRVPLSFQKSLYEEILRHYYTITYRGNLVCLLDYMGQEYFNLQKDMIHVFALLETVGNPKDETVFEKLVRPRAKEWLSAQGKVKSKTGTGLNHNIPTLIAYEK